MTEPNVVTLTRGLATPLGYMSCLSTPKVVIRKCGPDELYLNADGGWGLYRNAKRFKDADSAELFARQHTDDRIGLFPISKPKWMENQSG